MLLLIWYVGNEYYFPWNTHLLLPSMGQIYSATETRQVSEIRLCLVGSILQSFLLHVLFFSPVNYKDPEVTFLETGASPTHRVNLFTEQSFLCCHSSGGKGRVNI